MYMHLKPLAIFIKRFTIYYPPKPSSRHMFTNKSIVSYLALFAKIRRTFGQNFSIYEDHS
jgi:hypothetical protein